MEKEVRDREGMIGELMAILGIDYHPASILLEEHPEIAEKVLAGEELTEYEKKFVSEIEKKAHEIEKETIKRKIAEVFKNEGVNEEIVKYVVNGEKVPPKFRDERWNTLAEIVNKIMGDAKNRDIIEIWEKEPKKVKIKAKLIKYAERIMDAMTYNGNRWLRPFKVKESIRGAGALYLLEGEKSRYGQPLGDLLVSKVIDAGWSHPPYARSKKIKEEITKAHNIAAHIKKKKREEKKRAKKQKRLPI